MLLTLRVKLISIKLDLYLTDFTDSMGDINKQFNKRSKTGSTRGRTERDR